MIKVYGHPKTRSLRVVWLLEELDQEYEYQVVNFAKGESQSEAYLNINPAGKVPALSIDGQVMTESGAMVTYLSDKYASGRLIPSIGTSERAAYEQWSYFALSELEQPLWTMGKHKFALPKSKRVPEILETAAWEFQKALALLSNGLGTNQYILGDEFASVDILIAQILRWGLSFGQPMEQQNLKDYLARVEERPARTAADMRETQALAMQAE